MWCRLKAKKICPMKSKIGHQIFTKQVCPVLVSLTASAVRTELTNTIIPNWPYRCVAGILSGENGRTVDENSFLCHRIRGLWEIIRHDCELFRHVRESTRAPVSGWFWILQQSDAVMRVWTVIRPGSINCTPKWKPRQLKKALKAGWKQSLPQTRRNFSWIINKRF